MPPVLGSPIATGLPSGKGPPGSAHAGPGGQVKRAKEEYTVGNQLTMQLLSVDKNTSVPLFRGLLTDDRWREAPGGEEPQFKPSSFVHRERGINRKSNHKSKKLQRPYPVRVGTGSGGKSKVHGDDGGKDGAHGTRTTS